MMELYLELARIFVDQPTKPAYSSFSVVNFNGLLCFISPFPESTSQVKLQILEQIYLDLSISDRQTSDESKYFFSEASKLAEPNFTEFRIRL